MVLAGTSIGVILSVVLPSICITFALTGVLIFLLYKSGKKYLKLRKEEEKQRQEKSKENKEAIIVPSVNSNVEETQEEKELNLRSDEEIQGLRRIQAEESSHWVDKRMAIMFLLFTTLLGLQLMRGNKHYDSIIGVKACSFTDWSLLSLVFLICIGSFLLIVKQIRKRHAQKVSLGYQFHQNDLKYDNKTIVKLSILGICGGISGGCLGIGGGMIFNPILMDMGMLP